MFCVYVCVREREGGERMIFEIYTDQPIKKMEIFRTGQF